VARPRVVVLGGGMAGLAAAWELSSGDWRERLESITVYQRGWRLGGKGASSRGRHGRIEEHGLHLLLGCYDATFRVLRQVYAELDRPVTDPASPIRTWQDALTPTGDVGLAERDGPAWTSFVTRFSGNAALPGEPGAEDRVLTPLDVATGGLRLLADFHRGLAQPRAGVFLGTSPAPPAASDVGTVLRAAGLTALAGLLGAVERGSRMADDGRLPPVLPPGTAPALAAVLRASRDGLHAAVTADPAMRRTWQLVDLVITSLQGMAVDGLLSGEGWDRIDHLAYRDWLARHGAARETLDSPVVRGMQDLTFAYEGGDRTRPRFAAGLGLQLSGRMLFDSKGQVFWRMQAGMGEVVFAPLYQALRRRGVEFRFFSRLTSLGLAGRSSVGSITLARQADLAPGRSRYEPLVRVGGLPCWPARPLAGQLAADPGAGSETHGAPADTGVERLVAGRDFDAVVLAVSVGMVPHVAGELLHADPAWRDMVDAVGTVATRSAQLWLLAPESELGWTGGPGVTLSGFGDTFDTWASMGHLLPRERWPSSGAPRGLAYLCGAMADVDPARGEDVVRESLRRFLDEEVTALWPAARSRTGFRWDLLWDDEARTGPARLAAQHVRANLDPSDRYVQSLPGSGRYRIAPGRTGFDNLAVAGDWTACGFDAGCLEAATRSGVLAARAVLSGDVGAPAGRPV
jgi:uncharacterized protein with NAD-binding domain and iron-sulfur cluster